ncbi:MAG: hypothetical protein ABW202_04040 [Duganella sp.]
MKPIFSLLPALLFTLGAHAVAQNTPSQAPPKLDKIEEFSDDAVNIKSNQSQQGTQINDRRDNNGNIVETNVTSGPSTYKVRPVHPAGVGPVGEGPGPAIRGAQWTVMEFGPGKKKKAEDDSADAPPPPAPPAK